MKKHYIAFRWILSVSLAVLGAQPGIARELGDSNVLTALPGIPGYPEGIAVHKGLAYVSGPAAFGVPGNFFPSEIFAYDIDTGELVDTITIEGQSGPLNALSCLAFGRDHELYVVDVEQGILRIDVITGEQSVYAAPFFPVFESAFDPPAPVLPNDLAFDAEGYLYVTDSFQATIWRVEPGGGVPEVWFQDPAIDGPFGPNGVRIDKKSEKLYFTVTFTATGEGSVYTLPLIDHPELADLEIFHNYDGPDTDSAPDGIAFGKSGRLYVALAGTSEISILNCNGIEQEKFVGPAHDPTAPDAPLPWANPANIAFNMKTRSLLVTNHASLTGLPDPSHLFAIFDVFVDDEPGKLFKGLGLEEQE